eukprot:CAMPEP_0115890782 /NCGR_PEP_ID=MMETSP0287-20121206/33527_1 /TAXON_ID=412157 /ORGANISM="Chrysochromulina rotalis, Strain UIO044" /LENGTH=68 /DNA_ID=CAMNT_0003347561 /DNA_START=261 /DNA_END=468 /DNA_ORIENTATION=-
MDFFLLAGRGIHRFGWARMKAKATTGEPMQHSSPAQIAATLDKSYGQLRDDARRARATHAHDQCLNTL